MEDLDLDLTYVDFLASYAEKSEVPCSYCGGEMTKGDEERTGVCSKCYWELVTEQA